MHNRNREHRKTEINMKKTLVAALALAACAGTQLFAQNAKETVITLALTQYKQVSVSTSKVTSNAGTWETPPVYYKTATGRLSQTDIIKAISLVLHDTPSYYSSKAQLVLVQGELSGFFNVVDGVQDAVQNTYSNSVTSAVGPAWGQFVPNAWDALTLNGGGLVVRLATGRHYEVNPTTGAWPPGHQQPWGQIYVKDPGKAGYSASNPLCENVTFFFAITVEECYDCFYLNSFISDATFKFSSSTSGGPPCCDVPENLTGSGRDRYYMTMSFDNTLNNPYLNANNPAWVGWGQNLLPSLDTYNKYAGILGLNPFDPSAGIDGMVADFLKYDSNIRSQQGRYNPYVLRFTLNGVMTYTWALKFIDSAYVYPDFIGSASYPVSGFGFVGLYCSLFEGKGTIVDKVVKYTNCCLDIPWNECWFAPGWDRIGNSDTKDTPVNMNTSLSFHGFWDTFYVPLYQFPATQPDVPTGD